MSIDWTEVSIILLTALASAVFTGILAFAAQKTIDRWFARNLEKFRTDLQLASYEHQVRFGKLHEKRAEVIAELYGRLARAERSMNNMAVFINYLDTGVQNEFGANEHTNAFLEYFDENRLYIPPELCQQLDHLCGILRDTGLGFLLLQVPQAVGDRDKIERLEQEVRAAINEIPQIRQDIEKGFAQILGDFR